MRAEPPYRVLQRTGAPLRGTGAQLRAVCVTAVALSCLAVPLAACGGAGGGRAEGSHGGQSAEINPAGDIPDNQAFVRFTARGAGYSLEVPEGWAQQRVPRGFLFTDKLNAVRVEVVPARSALGLAQARAQEVPRLARTIAGFQRPRVELVRRPAGTAVRISYLATAAPDPVTGKRRVDAVERYVFFHEGRRVVLTLSSPRGADNVDPWLRITRSLRWMR